MTVDAVDILIVEDNPNDAELMIRVFRKHNLTNRLFVVEDGAEALDYLFARGKYSQRNAADKPRVVLLDVKLPKVSGLEVLRAIKSDPGLKPTPVVMVTSSHEDPDVRSAYESGANSYVVKPVGFDAFMEAVSSLGLYWLLLNRIPE